MGDPQGPGYTSALQDFFRARRRATLREVLKALTRRSRPLMNFEEVRQQLRAVEDARRELIEVPLDRIVGSVGRYNDFTREFLPLHDSDRSRWAEVQMAMTGLSGVPPVELYRIGDAYFVRDGNHRVSVARQLGNEYIQAYVTPLHSRVHLGTDTSPDELIIKAEQARFLQDTRMDELRPGSDLSVTAPGKYGKLRDGIRAQRWLLGQKLGREVSVPEAAVSWYDSVYLPVVREIRRHDLLDGFEGRTEADLYLWLEDHQGKLREELGFRLPAGAVAQAVSEDRTAGTPAGRVELLRSAGQEGGTRLYRDVLLGLPGSVSDQAAFRRALEVAAREGGELYVLSAKAAAPLEEELSSAAAERGVAAQFVTEPGNLADGLLERSRYSDLLVLPNEREFRLLVRRCRRPLLLVRSGSNVPRHLLLAFDGRSRSEEAMFHAAYLQLAWDLQLSVVTVAGTESVAERVLEQARLYLGARGVTADYYPETGPVTAALLSAAARLGCNMLALGSYKYSAWLETVLGGIPDELMRESDRDLLFA